MTPKDVQARVEYIRKLSVDTQAAHNAEDMLYAEVLRAIAEEKCSKPAKCAMEALKTEMIHFPRWCV